MIGIWALIFGLTVSCLAIFKSEEIIDSVGFVVFAVLFVEGVILASAGGIVLSGSL
jgi:hypothetical protein